MNHTQKTILLAALIWPLGVSAQENMKACNLLTPAELSAAIGGSVGHAHGIFTGKNSQSHGDFWSCEETVGTREVWTFYDTLPVTEEGKKLTQEMQERLRDTHQELQWLALLHDVSAGGCEEHSGGNRLRARQGTISRPD